MAENSLKKNGMLVFLYYDARDIDVTEVFKNVKNFKLLAVS